LETEVTKKKNVSVLNAKKSMHFIVRFEVKGVVLFVIGIHGNTVVDKEANDALEAPIYNCSIPFTDCKLFIMKYILKLTKQLGPANS
jgi:hypothetical protein